VCFQVAALHGVLRRGGSLVVRQLAALLVLHWSLWLRKAAWFGSWREVGQKDLLH